MGRKVAQSLQNVFASYNGALGSDMFNTEFGQR